MEHQGTVPKPLAGQEGTYLKGDGNWTTIPIDPNTTYTLDVPTATTNINLKGSDATDDPITLTGGTNVTITRTSANELTFSSIDTEGVTDVTGTLPITSTGGDTPDIGINTMGAASAIAAGTKGAVPVSVAGDQLKFLRADATWVIPTDNDTGITGVTLAIGTSTGVPLAESIALRELTLTSYVYDGGSNVGYVPTGGGVTTFLRGDGQWIVPTDTTYVAMTSTVLGLGKLWDNVEQTVVAAAVSTTASRTYGMQFNSADQLVVNVPWTDTQNPFQTITGTGTNNTDSGVLLSDGGGTVLVLGAGNVTASQTGNTITLTGTDTVYNKWILEGDNTGVAPQDITSGTTATFIGGTYLTTVAGSN